LTIINIVKKDIPEDLDKLSVFENLIDEFSTSSKNKLDILINMVKKPDKKIPLTSEIQNVVTTKNLSGEPVKPTTSYSSIGISLLDDPETFNSISEILYKNSNKEIHKLNNSGNCWSKSQTAMIVYQTYLIQHCSCGLHEISVKRLAEIAGVGITYMKGAKIISLKVPNLTSEIICGKTSIAKAHKEYLNAVGRCCSC
jgi:hypothetical protein